MNSFGHIFKMTTFGESHGHSVGVVIDGCPAGCEISLPHIQSWLDRRRPGQSELTTPRQEDDQASIVSGVENNMTLGSPITVIVKNKDKKPEDYQALSQVFRPSHADYTTQQKYGIRAASGGGRASARETIGRVAAAAVAEQVLQQILPELTITAWVHAIKDISLQCTTDSYSRDEVEASLVRCPDPETSARMIQLIQECKTQGDSVGGVITCMIQKAPVGLGEPVFDKLEADLAKAMLSLPATKSFELGSGLQGTRMFGSEHNDAFYSNEDGVGTRTNNSGGIQGGISNGQPIVFRTGFKPTSTIRKSQDTIDTDGKNIQFQGEGRHDPCVLPRAVPMVEAMATLVVLDHVLRLRSSRL